MTNFVAVGYEWREVPGADNASVEIEVLSDTSGLFVWAATAPDAVARPAAAVVRTSRHPPSIIVGTGKLWAKSSGDRQCYIDFDILGGSSGLTAQQTIDLATDLDRGESLGSLDPGAASGTLISQNDNDYFYNSADGNAIYKATAAGQHVSAFVKLPSVGSVVLVTSVPAATASSPLMIVNTVDGRTYFRDDLGGGAFVYTETRTNPAADEVLLVSAIPAATSASPELIVNRTDGKAYYLDDLGGGSYTYTQVAI